MGKKLIKSPVYLSKMSNLAFYQLTNSTFKIFAKEKKKERKPAIHWAKVQFIIKLSISVPKLDVLIKNNFDNLAGIKKTCNCIAAEATFPLHGNLYNPRSDLEGIPLTL